MKSKRNYSFKKAKNLITGIIKVTLDDMARYQNESIQRGIDTQTDIKGAKFAKLKKSTLQIRNKRGHGFTPLTTMKTGAIGVSGQDFSNKKSLRATKIIFAKQNNLTSKILMLTKHGVYHNEGFVTDNNSMIKNKKVPKREWFGITKDMKTDGKQYKTFVKMTLFKINQSLKK